MEERPKCETGRHKIPRGKHRQNTLWHISPWHLFQSTSQNNGYKSKDKQMGISVQYNRSVMSDSWTAVCQASLSITTSRHWLKLMSIKSVMPSHHLRFHSPLLFCLQSCPESRSFPVSQLFTSGGQRTGASASASVLPVNIQGWFPLRLTGLISLQS